MATAAATGPAASAVGGTLVLLAFMASLGVPGTFGLGPVNLTFYRLVLIFACIPLGLRWISGRAGPVGAVDLCYLASCIWISIALVAVHGLSRIVFIGTNFVELFCAYLVGRVLVRDAAGYRRFVLCMLALLAGLFPFVFVEFLTGKNLLRMVADSVMTLPEATIPSRRFGFVRAAGSFSHPIHFGLFASMAFANVYFLLWRRRELWRIGAAAFVGVTTMFAISSAGLFSLVLQTGMIVWERGLGFLRSRWVIAIALGIVMLFVLLVSVQGGLFTYIVENLIFAQGAGEHRLDIYHYGTLEVLRHPLFGVGLNDWARPFWRPHPTIDSFWLMTAVRHGIPAVALLVAGILLGMLRIATARGLDEDGAHYRSGYLIALTGLLLILSTVHIWGPVTVFVMAYLGAGAWFYTAASRPPDDPVRLRREAASARLRHDGESTRLRRDVEPARLRHEAIVRPRALVYEGSAWAQVGSEAGTAAARRGAGGTAATGRDRGSEY